MIARWFGIFCTLLIVALPLHSTTVTPGGGPPGGSVIALALDPSNPSTMYAGTQVSENFFEHNKNGGTLFKSTNGGQSWSFASNGLPDDPVQSLSVDPKNLGTVYAGTFSNGIFKSVDGGQNWAATNMGMTDLWIIVLAIDPSNSSTIYAGTNGSTGFFRSTDAGLHWSPVSLGFPSLSVVSIAFDPTNSKAVYVGTPRIDPTTAGFFRSTDGGQTWTISGTGLVEPPTGRAIGVSGIAINPTNPAVLYVTGGSVFKSVDGGQSWTLMTLRLGVSFLFLDPLTSGTLYAAGTAGFFKSMDGAASWKAMNSGLTDFSIRALIANPASPFTLYVGTGSDGAFKTTDGGQSWSRANTGMNARSVGALAADPANPSTLYSGSVMSLFKTVDAGVTWSVIDSGIDPTLKVNSVFGFLGLTVDPTDSNTVYAGGAIPTTLLKSTNAGQSWAPLNDSFLGNVTAVVVDPTASSTVYAGSTVSGVLKSTDGGQSWSLTSISSSQGKTVTSLAIDPTNTATLYAGSFGIGGGVYKTADGAQSWAQVLNESIMSVAVNPVLPATVYAGNATGSVYKSTDAGQTWTSLGPGITDGSGNPVMVRTLAIDPITPANIYAGTFGAGIIKSTDGGQTWSTINTGLPNLRILRVVLDQANPSTIYAGTLGSGVFKTTSGGRAWQGTGAKAPSVSSISPPSGKKGQDILNFTVGGSNFDPNATLSFSDNRIAVNSYGSRAPTAIVADIKIGQTVPQGAYDVIVTNPDGQVGKFPGGFTAVGPTITSAVPTTGIPGENLGDFVVAGNSFDANSTLSFSGKGISHIAYISRTATKLVARFVIDTTAPIGEQNLIITNPDGSSGILLGGFTVTQSTGFLTFPLLNKTAFTAKINTVFDHSMTTSYCPDGKVEAYTNEVGDFKRSAFSIALRDCNGDGQKETLYGFSSSQTSRFLVNGQYTGNSYLYYDGHPGFDYRASCGTPVHAAVSGTVRYPTSFPGVKDAASIHALELDPDPPNNNYKLYYLHLSTYPTSPYPSCQSAPPIIPPSCTGKPCHVDAGQLIGKSGDAGLLGSPNGSNAHLHFEVQILGFKPNKAGVPVDPYGWWQGKDTDPYILPNVNLWK